MKRMIGVLVAFAACGLVGIVPAFAVCGSTNNLSFESYYYGGFVGTEADLLGGYWILGMQDTVNSGGLPPAAWMGECSGGGICGSYSVYVNGSWADSPQIKGCPPAPPPATKMVFQISGPMADGSAGFIAACTDGSPFFPGHYFFGYFTDTPFPMQAIPKPNVTNSTSQGGGTSVLLDIAPPPPLGGIQDTGDCGLGVRGYRVYSQTVPRGSPAPISRVRDASWIPLGGVVSPTSSTQASVPCDANFDVYLVYSLLLNDGVELGHVGKNSTVVQCGPTVADRPGHFRFIRKPVRRPTEAE